MSDNNLSRLAQEWLDAKQAESEAVERRRAIEDKMASLIGKAENDETTTTVKPDGYTIKIIGKVSRTVDSDKLQELAHENGLFEHLQSLFRWTPSIDKRRWEAADTSITAPLASAITAKPGRFSFKIEKNEEK